MHLSLSDIGLEPILQPDKYASETTERAHLSLSDIGLEPILQPDKHASETTERAHLSHSDIGLEPILQHDNACMTLGNYNRHGFRTFDQFEHNFLDPGSSGHTRLFSIMDTVSNSDDEYTCMTMSRR